MTPFAAFNLILENPGAKKGYLALARYYREKGMREESSAFEFLLKTKFYVDDIYSDEERSKNS